MALAAIRTQIRTRNPLLLHSLLPLPNPHFLSTSTDFRSDSDFPANSFPESPNLPLLLRLIAKAKSESSDLHQALEMIRGSCPIDPTEELICGALAELRSDWEAASLAFRWGRGSASGCEAACNAMVWSLGAAGEFGSAWALVRKMHRKSVLSRTTMVILMERYAAANEARKALKTFHAMEKFKINTDSMTFYALLRALCKNRDVEEAEEFLLQNQKFFPLETEGFNVILDGWCNIIIDLVEAKRIWREMSNYCITPDGTSYSHMIRCFSKVGNLCDSLRLYDQMKNRGWIPGLVVYNSLIYALARENCLKEARKVFDKISELGMQPDIETYNSMIHPLCEAQRLEEAWKLMDDMTESNIHPTLETYHAFAKAENLQGTLKLLKRMKDASCNPTTHTFLVILDKFFRSNNPESALRMWSTMRSYNIVPESSHYMVLVQGLAILGWMPKAIEFNNEMKSKGFAADPKLEKVFEAFAARNRNHWGRGGKEFITKLR